MYIYIYCVVSLTVNDNGKYINFSIIKHRATDRFKCSQSRPFMGCKSV